MANTKIKQRLRLSLMLLLLRPLDLARAQVISEFSKPVQIESLRNCLNESRAACQFEQKPWIDLSCVKRKLAASANCAPAAALNKALTEGSTISAEGIRAFGRVLLVEERALTNGVPQLFFWIDAGGQKIDVDTLVEPLKTPCPKAKHCLISNLAELDQDGHVKVKIVTEKLRQRLQLSQALQTKDGGFYDVLSWIPVEYEFSQEGRYLDRKIATSQK